MADTSTFDVSAIDKVSYSRPPGGAALWVLVSLAVYIAFWVFTRNVTHYNLDRHGDMVENFAWGMGWQLGYQKHPPLFAWITALWFEVFPRTNVAYFLLSSVNVAIAAFVMWLISRRYLTEWQQTIAVLMVFALPLLGFQAMVYNANSAMLPFWALGFLFYLRTIERRRLLDAALVGAFCGLAILVKYHSAVLILAIIAHATFDREVRPIIRTAIPWVAAAAGAVVIAPHIWWMIDTQFQTIHYAAEQGDGRLLSSFESVVSFLGAFLLYAIPGLLIVLLYWRTRDGLVLKIPDGWRALVKTVEGRALVAVTLGTIGFTVALALLLQAQLSSLWAIPLFFTAPIFLAALVPPERAARYWHTAPVTMLIFCAVVIAIAPSLRAGTLSRAASNSVQPIADLAPAVQRSWREATGARLAIVASDEYFLANGTAFYASDTPYAVQGTLDVSPWVTQVDIERDGAVYICRETPQQQACAGNAGRFLGVVNAQMPVTIPSIEGAGGPQNWNYILYMRYPSADRAR